MVTKDNCRVVVGMHLTDDTMRLYEVNSVAEDCVCAHEVDYDESGERLIPVDNTLYIMTAASIAKKEVWNV